MQMPDTLPGRPFQDKHATRSCQVIGAQNPTRDTCPGPDNQDIIPHLLWRSLDEYEVPCGSTTPIIYIYGHYIISDGCYFLSYSYNLDCVAHYFLPCRYDSLSYQQNFLWEAYYFFCYIQNSVHHAFNLLFHGYILFCYSCYSLCDIHYEIFHWNFQKCSVKTSYAIID